MGMSEKELLDRLEEIFSDISNFDESGWARAELVTTELAEGLWKYIQEHGVMAPKLLRRGFGVRIFREDCSDGIIAHRAPGRGLNYMLRLYYDQDDPMLREKGGIAVTALVAALAGAERKEKENEDDE